MKCLVADESSLMRRIMIRALATLEHRDVIEVTDGVEALQHCDQSVGLVITDWTMPTMSGVEMVRHLRANPATASVPVIMVSSRNLRESVAEAVEAGVNAYLLKPVSAETLRNKIEQILRARGAANGAGANPAEAVEAEADDEGEVRKAA